MRCYACACYRQSSQVGPQHSVINCAPLIRDVVQKNRSGDVCGKAILTCPKIYQQRIARLDRIVMPRMGMAISPSKLASAPIKVDIRSVFFSFFTVIAYPPLKNPIKPKKK